MSDHPEKHEQPGGYDLAVEEARPKVKQPPLYRVVLINDDFEQTLQAFESIVFAQRQRLDKQQLKNSALIADLLQ